MKALYVETSAILRYLFGEDGADSVKKTIDSSVQVLSSRLTVLEVHRAVGRAEKQAEVSAADAERVRGTLTRIVRSWFIHELSTDILDRAAKEFPIEPVRSLDAIHLATSLGFLRIFPDLHVLSFDDRVMRNAGALGIPLAG
jgi:predicted nucleic acid-binding protein